MKRGSRIAQSSLKVRREKPDGVTSSRTIGSGRDGRDERPTAGPTLIRPADRGLAERYRLGDLAVDVGAGVVKRGDQTLALPPLSFSLFVALIRRAPQTVRRQ